MSLTNPVLNDILTKEINILRNVILSMESKMENYINNSKKSMDDLSERIQRQDTKIDVIHKLFNSYKNIINTKTTNEYKMNNYDYENVKKRIEDLENNTENLTSFLLNLINERTKSQQEQITELKTNFNNRVNSVDSTKFALIENSNKQLLEQIMFIRNEYNNFSKNVGDNNYRLNGLESKYRNLDRKINSVYEVRDERVNTDSYDEHFENENRDEETSINDERGENWIKVTKKKSNRRFNNRF